MLCIFVGLSWGFEKLYIFENYTDGISNQKTNVSICTGIHIAAILDFSKWLPENVYLSISQLPNVSKR